MSTFYKKAGEVPTAVIATRLIELAKAASDGIRNTSHEFTMRIPAELDRDADLVMAEAANRLVAMQAELAAIRALEPLARIYVGSHPGEELIDWEIAPYTFRCDAANEMHENNPATLKLYALPEHK